MFLLVAGKLKSLEYDCTFSATFLKSSTLKVNGISSSWYKSQITWPSTKSVIVPVGVCSLSVIEILSIWIALTRLE